MSILGSIFGTSKAPTLSTTDYTAAANQGASYNSGLINQYESYAPGFTDFIKNLYNNTVNPQATSAQNTQYNIGNQLATNGYTDAQSNYLSFARQQGLEAAAATGAPTSSAFTQSLGNNLGMQQILNNQLQGTNLLNNYSQNQQQLAQSFMQPSLNVMNRSFVNPTAFMQGAAANNSISNQNRYINFANSNQNSFFDNVVSGTLGSLISTPFSFSNNISGMSSNIPQTSSLFTNLL